MSTSTALCHGRQLSTAAAAATNATAAAASISISRAKSKLRSEQDPDKALEIYTSVANRYTSPVSYRHAQGTTVKLLAKSNRFSDIENLIESHKNDPKITEEPFLCTLIRSYGRAGMFDHALKTYNQMEELGTPRSTLSFNALLSACIDSKQFDRALQLFEEMPEKHGFRIDKFSYGILIKAYCELGNPELAIERLNEMEEKGVEITAFMFTPILHSLYRKGNVDEAERIWDEMVRKGCNPDVVAYNVRLMNAQSSGPDSVKALMEEMSKAGVEPDTISYNYLMSSYCQNGMMREAKEVYDRLKENKGCHPNATTFRTLVFHLCKNEQFETGYKVFKESVKFHKIPDFTTLKLLAEGLVKKSRKRDAKGLIRTMKKRIHPSLHVGWNKLEDDLGLASVDPEASNQEAHV